MGYLKRKADLFLKEWKADENRLPLLVSGARQVGKTETIRHFSSANYESVVEVNFVDSPINKGITQQGYSPKNIISLLSQYSPSFRFIPGRTLLFFDEIQEHPDILTALKFFKQDGRFDVIASGSLLGIQYGDVKSFSVGYQSSYEMMSLDFEEFLWALGYGDEPVDEMLSRMVDGKPFGEPLLSFYRNIFLNYLVLGGMPAVVNEYLRQNTFERTWTIQWDILKLYRSDVGKYTKSLDRARILTVFDQIPLQLAKEYKRFQYSKIAPGARSSAYAGCVEWIDDAGMVNLCHGLVNIELPLKAFVDASRFKLYMADTGLLIAMMDEYTRHDVRANRNLGVYKGAIYENLAAEALVKQGYDLFYYKRENSTLEQDFLVRLKDEILPIEVKAGNNRAKSLRELVSSSKYPLIRQGLKFANADVGRENSITTLPYFTLFLLKRFLEEQ